MDINKEREEFDVYFKGKYPELYKDVFDKDGDDRAIIGYSFAWSAWQAAKAQAVPEGFVLVEREKLAMIFETATNALVYHAAPPKHDALSTIQGIARKAMIEAQEPAND